MSFSIDEHEFWLGYFRCRAPDFAKGETESEPAPKLFVKGVPWFEVKRDSLRILEIMA